jgi:nucleotide-binding universal stress UspA family protein
LKKRKKKNNDDTTILCPVRGGKESARTVDRAIELAGKYNAQLYFLYIIDIDFLDYATVARVNILIDELDETGQFALSILTDKAKKRGVSKVNSIIKKGNIRQVIQSLIAELKISILVMGRPIQQPGIKTFSKTEFNKFINEINEKYNIQVEYVC